MSKISYLNANVEVNTTTFSGWIERTNRVIYDMGTVVVTVNNVNEPNTTNGAWTTGNANIEGYFSANVVAVQDELRGGTVETSAPLLVTSNTTFQNEVILGSNTSDTVTFNSTVNSDIVSTSTKTFDLGSNTSYWNNFYTDMAFVDTDIEVSGKVIIIGNSPRQLISESTNTTFQDLELILKNSSLVEKKPLILDIDKVYSDSNNVYDFGISTNRWKTSYTKDVDVSNSAVITNNLDVGANTDITGILGVDGDTSLNSITESSSPTTGALTVSGGVGINKNLNVAGIADIDSNTALHDELTVDGDTSLDSVTQSSSPTTGALTVAGGVGINKNLNVAGITTIQSNTDISGVTTVSNTVNISTDLNVSGNSDLTGTLDVDGDTSVNSITESSSPTTGALTVAGGVGINKNLHVSGVIDVDSHASLRNGLTVDGNVSLNSITQSSSPTSGALTVTGGVGVGKNLHVAGIIDVDSNSALHGTLDVDGDTSVNSITESSSPTTGALTVAGGVGINKNLYVGGIVDIASNTNIDGITTVSNTVNISTDLNVSGNSDLTGTLDVDGNVSFNSITQSSSPTSGALTVAGGVGINKNLHVAGIIDVDSNAAFHGNLGTDGAVSFNSTTQSTSTATGALTVAGGVGVGKILNVGSNLTVGANTTISGNTSIGGTATVTGDVDVGGKVSASEIRSDAGSFTVGSGGNQVIFVNDTLYQANADVSFLGFVNFEQTVTFDSNAFLSVNNSFIDHLTVEEDLRFTPSARIISDILPDTSGGSVNLGNSSNFFAGMFASEFVIPSDGEMRVYRPAIGDNDATLSYNETVDKWQFYDGTTTRNIVGTVKSGSTDAISINGGTTSSDTEITVAHKVPSGGAATNISVNGSGGTVLQDISLGFDSYGHVTSATSNSTNLDSRYYTKGTADSRFYNASGDTLSGNMNVNNQQLLNTQAISLNDRIYHNGDTDTYTQFLANTWRVVAGNGERFRANTQGVHINGNLYLNNAGTTTTQAVRADRTITAGDGLSGGGNLTGNRTLSVDSTVLRTSDEGQGNGLDADKVDGIHASQFLRSDTNDTMNGNLTVNGLIDSDTLSYTRAGQIASGTDLDTVVTSGAFSVNGPVNGPGSGWWYLEVIRHNGSASYVLQRATSLTQSTPRTYYRVNVNGTWGSWQFMWHSGNDGSGSGLDADTVDGLQAWQFLRSDTGDVMSGLLNVQNLNLSDGNPRIRFDDDDTTNNGEITLDNTSLRIGVDEDNTQSSSQIAFRVDGNYVAIIDQTGFETDIITATSFSGDGSSVTNVNADKLDSLQSSQFLRSDVNDTMNGDLTVNGISSVNALNLTNSEIASYNSDGYVWHDSSEGIYHVATASSYGNAALLWSRSNFTDGDGINVSYNSSGRPTLTVDSSVVRTSRSISSGDGLSGGGNLSANRTLSVDGTVVRTSGTQTINGEKTFSNFTKFPSGFQAAATLIVNPSTAAVGINSNPSSGVGLLVKKVSGLPLRLDRGVTNGDIISFLKSGSYVAGISITASSVSYNTGSDYRLKENITPSTDSLEKIMSLPVKEFNFKADPDKRVNGFIAHELEEFIPAAVTGEKDAIDENGNPVYQQVDYSKVIPELTGALQEAVNEIRALKDRIEKLEKS